MKSLKQILLIGGWLCLAASPGLAQTNPVNTATQVKREGQVVGAESITATDDANVTASNLRPPRSERPELSPAVRAQIQRLNLDRRAYLERQQALKKKLEGANDRDRAAIREQLKELQQQWLEQAKELAKQYKERREELYDKLKEHRELLDNARSPALRDASGGGRTRQGD